MSYPFRIVGLVQDFAEAIARDIPTDLMTEDAIERSMCALFDRAGVKCRSQVPLGALCTVDGRLVLLAPKRIDLLVGSGRGLIVELKLARDEADCHAPRPEWIEQVKRYDRLLALRRNTSESGERLCGVIAAIGPNRTVGVTSVWAVVPRPWSVLSGRFACPRFKSEWRTETIKGARMRARLREALGR